MDQIEMSNETVPLLGEATSEVFSSSGERNDYRDSSELERRNYTENSEDTGGQTRSGNKCALASLLLMCGVFMSVSFVKKLTTMVSTISNAFNSVAVIVGIFVVILLHVVKRKSTAIQFHRHGDSGFRYFMQNHVTLIPIVILYAVGLILDYFTIINGVSCSDVWYQCGEVVKGIHISGLTFTVLRIVFMGSMTLFCRNFYNMRFDNSGSGIRFGLVVLASLNLSLWFDSLSLEIFDRNGKNLDNLTQLCVQPVNDSRAYVCLNRANKEHASLKNVKSYIYPMRIEYFLLVCEFLFSTFLNNTSKCVMDSDDTIDHNISNHSSKFGADYDSWNVNDSALKTYLQRALITIIFPASGILFCTLAFFDSKLLNGTSKTSHREIFYLYSVVYYATMTLAVIGCVLCRRNFTKIKTNVTAFHWLVMLSAAGLILENVLRISAIAELLKCDYWSPTNNTCGYRVNSKPHLEVDPRMFIITDAFDTVQVIVQIPFVAYCQRVFVPSRPRLNRYRRIYQTLLLFLIMSNFANWIMNSILFAGISPIYVYFESIVSIWVVSLISPFEVFFRISSTILFLQVYIREVEMHKSGIPLKLFAENATESCELEEDVKP